MLTLNVFTSLTSIVFFIVIVWLLRRGHLHALNAFFWLALATAALLLGSFPRLIDMLAGWVGISYPPALLLLLTCVVLSIKALHADTSNTRIERDQRRLNQRVAMLELQINQTSNACESPTHPQAQ